MAWESHRDLFPGGAQQTQHGCKDQSTRVKEEKQARKHHQGPARRTRTEPSRGLSLESKQNPKGPGPTQDIGDSDEAKLIPRQCYASSKGPQRPHS